MLVSGGRKGEEIHVSIRFWLWLSRVLKPEGVLILEQIPAVCLFKNFLDKTKSLS
jgi:hypothetical protein